MRLLDTEVKYFDNNSKGISSIINQWGAMINILDFCLVEGSPEKPVLSISTVDDTSYSNIYWISTIYLNKNHGFKKDLSVVEIAGSLEEAYNKCHRVQDVSENYITIAFDFYEYNKNRKYDLLGLLCTLSDRLKTNNKNKLFCSELIAEILDLKLYENQSPERIYKYIIKELG